MANQLLVSFEQIIQGVFGGSVKEMLKYKHEFNNVDKKKFDDYVNNSVYGKEKMGELQFYEAISGLLSEMSPDF